ncbi:hypothetical protein MKX01_010282 [Papaver californicum]|nr:hypothetical protein MKX01_010282 [Papaver californicum]
MDDKDLNQYVEELELLKSAADLRIRLIEEREKMNTFKQWGFLEFKYQMLLVFFLLIIVLITI